MHSIPHDILEKIKQLPKARDGEWAGLQRNQLQGGFLNLGALMTVKVVTETYL